MTASEINSNIDRLTSGSVVEPLGKAVETMLDTSPNGLAKVNAKIAGNAGAGVEVAVQVKKVQNGDATVYEATIDGVGNVASGTTATAALTKVLNSGAKALWKLPSVPTKIVAAVVSAVAVAVESYINPDGVVNSLGKGLKWLLHKGGDLLDFITGQQDAAGIKGEATTQVTDLSSGNSAKITDKGNVDTKIDININSPASSKEMADAASEALNSDNETPEAPTPKLKPGTEVTIQSSDGNTVQSVGDKTNNPDADESWIDQGLDDFKEWYLGVDDSETADKSEVLDQPVSDNTGEGVGNGIDASNINVSPSIIDMAGDIFTVAIGLASAAISSIAAGISSAVSFVGGAIGNFLGWLGDLVGIGDNSSASGANTGTAHPIIIDLDNDGLELGNLHKSSVFFDIDGDGYLEKTAWTTGDDGILVVDLFADGEITFGEEINFTLWDETATTDMEALRNVFDSNLNGMLDAEDGRFSDFKIWQDFNQNGFVDENELKTLNEMGISAISLDSRVPVDEDDGIVVAGNVVYDDTDIDWLNGNSGRAYDTALRYSIGGISFDGDDEEFSINYEDGRTVSVYRAPDENTSVLLYN